VRAQRVLRRAGTVERTLHRGFGHALLRLVVDEIHQHRDAERVRYEDELLALVVAHVAGVGEEFDSRHPLVRRRAHFAHEGVQVLDQARHHFLEARIFRVLDPAQHFGDERLFVEIADGHGKLLLISAMLPSRPSKADSLKILFASTKEKPEFWFPLLRRALPNDQFYAWPDANGGDIDVAIVATHPQGTFASLNRLNLPHA